MAGERLFSIAMQAYASGVVALQADTLIAVSEREAEIKGQEMAHKEWPSDEGWSNHSVVVREVPRELMQRCLASSTREVPHSGVEEDRRSTNMPVPPDATRDMGEFHRPIRRKSN